MQLRLGRNLRSQVAQALFDPRPIACNQFARALVVHRVLPCFVGQDPASVTYGPDAGSSQSMNGTSNTIASIVEREVATPEDYGAPRFRSSRLGGSGTGVAIPDFRRESAAPVRREMDVVISAGARVAGGVAHPKKPTQSVA